MRLASYNLRGRPSFGAVVGEGIVDLRVAAEPLRHAPRSLSRPCARRGESRRRRRAAGRAAGRGRAVAAAAAPEKILCIGINYTNRERDYDFAEPPKYPSMFYRAPNSVVGSGRKLIRPKISEQLDYEGEIAMVIGRECKHVPKERALDGDRRR